MESLNNSIVAESRNQINNTSANKNYFSLENQNYQGNQSTLMQASTLEIEKQKEQTKNQIANTIANAENANLNEIQILNKNESNYDTLDN